MTESQYIKVVPSKRQLIHQRLEFYAFFHFSVNTFTGREWGDGTESPMLFNPVDFDARQWVDAIKKAGMNGAILTCKHHDGFCLWPSKYTSHSIESSPYKNGHGDIVREVSDACKQAGIKFGIYLSPWDRNFPFYGHGESYDEYFVKQLTELLTDYGDIFSVWLDGACGEGFNGKIQVYDWDLYYKVIRKLQPNACISVCGPDVRWCGNEAGDIRESEWSVVPKRLSEAERIQKASQHTDDEEFREKKLKSSMLDLGSRKALEGETELIWYPAEVNTSIRPGWFYNCEEDDKVKSLDELLRVYYGSVGGNSTFLLNVPPMPNGLIHENDVKRLCELGQFVKDSFAVNLAEGAKFISDTDGGEHTAENIRLDDGVSYFKTNDGTREASITIDFGNEIEASFLVLKEKIELSQRIEKFNVEILSGNEYMTVYRGTVVGYKKIVLLGNVRCSQIRINITESRVSPTLDFVGVY